MYPIIRQGFHAVVLSLVLILSACAGITSFEKPTISIADLKPTKFSRDGQIFTLKLKVDNPNALAIPVDGMNYALNIAGFDVASGQSMTAVKIPANGTGYVEVDINANIIEVLPQIAKAVMSGDRNLSYAVNGAVKLDSAFVKEIPFDSKGEIPFNPFDLMKLGK